MVVVDGPGIVNLKVPDSEEWERADVVTRCTSVTIGSFTSMAYDPRTDGVY